MQQITMAIALLLLVLIQTSSSSANPYSCAQGQFYNTDQMLCVPCSPCPANKFILRSCWGVRDTKCGTFGGKFQFRQPSKQISGSAVVKPKSEVTNQLPVPNKTTMMIADTTSGDRWFTITMVLVGILVFMSVLGVVLAIVSCYVCKKNKQREIICDPGKHKTC